MTLSTSAVAVCCCKRFAQLVEQPRVLDGDDGLRGEVLHQRDLLIGEWSYLLPINTDDADQNIVLQHRHVDNGSVAPELNARHDERIAIDIRLYLRHIGDVSHFPCFGNMVKAGSRRRIRHGLVPVLLGQFRWRVVERDATKASTLVEPKHPELCAADARCVAQQSVENRLKPARGGGDDLAAPRMWRSAAPATR